MKKKSTINQRLILLKLFLIACFMCLPTILSAQTIMLNYQNVPLETVLKSITGQTGYKFVYADAVIDKNQSFSIQVSTDDITAVLNELFKKTYITYTVVDKQIVLRYRQENRAAPSQTLTGNSKEITGRVIDQNGLPLAGANVYIEGTTTGTITDENGFYKLSVKNDPNIKLSFRLLGMGKKAVLVGIKTRIDIVLTEDSISLNQVVVTGYQTISKERATGAYNVIKSDMIEKSRASDLSTALLGAVAGMQGKENADGSISYTIRGLTSLYADAQPLVVVDGFPVANGFKDINPNDVESVTVLKDAAAASIWGARSANGAIVITLKNGKTANPQTSEKFNIGFSTMMRIGEKIDLSTALTTASAADQVAWERMAYEKKWYQYTYSDSFNDLAAPYSLAKELLFQQATGKITMEQMNAGLKSLSESDNRKQIKDYLLQNPILQQYHLTLSNSSARMQNYVSLQYEHGQGNMVNNGLDRWRLSYNTQASVFNWLDLTFSTNLHYLYADNSGPTMNELKLLSPYEKILNDDGSYATQLMGVNREQYEKIKGSLPYEDWDYNILRETRARELTNWAVNSRFQVGLTFKILQGLTFDTKFQYEYNIGKTRNYYKEDSYYVRDWVNFIVDYDQVNKKVNRQFIPKGGILQTAEQTDRNYTWRNQVNLNRTFNAKHAVTALFGTEISEYCMDSTNNPWTWGYDDATNRMAPLPYGGRTVPGGVQLKNIMGTNLAQFDISGSGAFWYVDQRVGSPKSRQRQDRNTDAASFDYRNDRYVSVYGNVSYAFDGKYSISGSARSDASNLITNDSKYRWAPLWSVGGLWHIHRERFMEAASNWMNRLSLRLTYGFNGNVEKSTSPLTLIGMSSTPSLNTGTYTGSIANYGNPLLRWERTGTTNIGVDFSLFNNLLFGSINGYDKKGVDILGNIALPAMAGTTTQRINQAKISNKGIELELGVNTALGSSGVLLNTKLTYAYNKNEVTNLFNPNVQASTAVYGQAFTEGYPIGAIWSFVYAGMKEGEPYLSRKDGTTYPMSSTAMLSANINDGYVEYGGPATSPHSAGWQGTLSGYGFNFSFLLIGNFGGHFRNPTFSYPLLSLGKDIIPMFVNDVINGSPDIPSWPEANSSTFGTWSYYTPYLNTLVENSSFIKLKELNLEYQLPEKWMSLIRMKQGSARLYAQVRDLGCLWVANSRGYDPEWLPGTLPPTTSYVFGLHINF